MSKETTDPTVVPTNVAFLTAFLEVQKALAKGVEKNSVNPHFKNDYADRTGILQFVLPILHENGFVLTQALSKPDANIIDHAEQDYLYINTTLHHVVSGAAIGDVAKCPLPKSDPQGYGSAVTYLSRYAIVSLLALPLLDDDDGNSGSGRAAGKQSSTTEKKSTSPSQSSSTTTKTPASTTTKKGSAATKSDPAAKSAATTQSGADDKEQADPTVDQAAVEEAETGKAPKETAGAKPKGKLWGSKSAK